MSIPETSQFNIVVGEPETGPIAGFQKYEYEKAMDGRKMGKGGKISSGSLFEDHDGWSLHFLFGLFLNGLFPLKRDNGNSPFNLDGQYIGGITVFLNESLEGLQHLLVKIQTTPA